jgi:hypothetical protein
MGWKSSNIGEDKKCLLLLNFKWNAYEEVAIQKDPNEVRG